MYEVRATGHPLLLALCGWLVPGAGHFLLGRWGRGLVICLAVSISFVLGLALGGHLFTLSLSEKQGMLQLLPAIPNVGTGLLYVICLLTGTGFMEEAQRSTYEYGTTFLLVAGLLNYLGMLDAYDLAVGRKS